MVRISLATVTIFTTLLSAPFALALTPNNAGAKNVGAANGQQFITGGCTSGADCASACCAGGATSADGAAVGICSAEAAQNQAGKTGCGFVDPNADATIAAAKAQVEKQGF